MDKYISGSDIEQRESSKSNAILHVQDDQYIFGSSRAARLRQYN
jgi:hypothetical protein